MLRKILKYIAYLIAGLFLVFNLAILFSGRTFLYKGLWHTYFKGRTGPSAIEYTIFENRKIKAVNPQSLTLSRNYNSSELPKETAEIFSKYKTHALVIIRNDSLLHEQYWDGYSDTSHTNSFSISKTFVSALLGCALKDGYIKDINEPVANYIPEFKTLGRESVTLKNLVSMTSGIDFDENYINPFAYPAAGYYGDNLFNISCHYGMWEKPGTTFKYLSGNSALLGICITKAVGKPLSHYLSERLWKDLGCEQPAWWSLDKKDGYEKGFCCLNSNAKDLSRLGMLYLNNGKWKGKQIIDSAYVKESIIPFACNEEDGCKNRTYGYSWWLTSYNNLEVFYARGILGQYLICVPKYNIVIVKMGRERRPKTTDDHCPEDVATCISSYEKMYLLNQ